MTSKSAFDQFDLTDLDLTLSDSMLGRRLWRQWVKDNAAAKRSTPDLVEDDLRDAVLARLDIVNLNLLPLEKALRRAAAREFAAAGQIIRSHLYAGALQIIIEDEARTGRRRGRAIARKPRPDELQDLIGVICNMKPDISAKGLERELKRRVGKGTVIAVNDDSGEIIFNRGGRTHGVAAISGLKDRLTRAKKKSR